MMALLVVTTDANVGIDARKSAQLAILLRPVAKTTADRKWYKIDLYQKDVLATSDGVAD